MLPKEEPRELGELLVIKVGTSTLLPGDSGERAYSLTNIGKIVDLVLALKKKGWQVILVASGAVGAGCLHLGICTRPSLLELKQAVSAVGQCRLMRVWEELFSFRDQKAAQLLITRGDLMDKQRFLNFKHTLKCLLELGVVPIVNENDSVATAQLKFGDNDTLAMYCAVSLSASWLILLTDVDYLYTANPRMHPDAQPIPYVGRMDDVFSLVREDENCGTSWGSGGMSTKLNAAKIASAAGVHTGLCNGEHAERVLDIVDWGKLSMDCSQIPGSGAPTGPSSPAPGSETDADVEDLIGRGMEVGVVRAPIGASLPYVGTVFAAKERIQHMQDQRRWILSLPLAGKIIVDEGAARALVVQRSSLLAVGVVKVFGKFTQNSVVGIYLRETRDVDSSDSHFPDSSLDEAKELARVLVNYSSADLELIRGRQTRDFPKILGTSEGEGEVASRPNIILVNPYIIYDIDDKLDRSRQLELELEAGDDIAHHEAIFS